MTHGGLGAAVEALFDAAPVGMAIFDASHRFVRINPAMAAINGLPVGAHLGRSLEEVLPELAPVVGPILDRVVATGERVKDLVVAGSTPLMPGVARVWRASYLPIELGDESGVAVFVEERTAQLAAEQALRESEDQFRASELRFRTICETAPIGIFLSDAEGGVVYSNPAAQEMVGLPEEELLGTGWARLLDPEDLPGIAAALEAGRTDPHGFSIHARVHRPDGKLIWTETVGREVYDGERHIGRVSLTTDVTERHRILAALHESEELFRELAENVDAVFYLAKPDAVGVDYVSPGFWSIWGRTPDELREHPHVWLDAIHPDDRERVRETFQSDRTGFRAEYRVVRPDGSIRWISDRSFPVRNAEGKVIRVAGVATDETQRHTLETQLLQAQRLESIGRLAGGVAHDFNNLLTVIMSHAAFARQDLRHAGEDLLAIEQAGARASELTGQLLSFARRQVIEPRVVDLNALTTQIDRMLRRLIGEDVELETRLEPRLWPVKVDPAQMEQVLVNLAVNGRDAMPNGGRLTVETANVVLDEGYRSSHADVVPGEYVMLGVSDNGLGIEPELLPMIFEPFFTTKPNGAGTGLGLATCYGIVKQAGGHIWAYSEPGAGATFKVYLPRAEGVPGASGTGTAAAAARGHETVLLVEDDDSVRAIAVRTLRSQGFQVLEAVDGVAALEVAAGYEGTIHLLLTDVVMPRMGGKELAARLLELRPETKVLYASGYTRNAIVHHGVLEQGTNFLQKPYVPDGLARKVREVIDGGRETGDGGREE